MSRDAGGDGFLGRWSRLKEEARARGAEAPEKGAPLQRVDAPQAGDGEAPPELPPVETLGPDSDYRAFLHPKVEERLRRTALKKLFSDPRFNVMDGLDVYIDDYSRSEPLTEAMLAQLEQAKKIFAWAREDAQERARQEAAAQQDEIVRPGETTTVPPAQPAPGDTPASATLVAAKRDPDPPAD